MTTHWHTGYGLSGYGPDGEDCATYDSVLSVAQGASDELRDCAESAHDSAYSLADAEQYADAWAELKVSDTLDALRHNLNVASRASAPLFSGEGGEGRLVASMTALLADAPYPLDAGDTRRMYAWECDSAECELDAQD